MSNISTEKNLNIESKRMPNIELLRVLSMIMIMFLHLFNQGKILETVESGVVYYFVWIVEGICFISVNCYMLISGFFLWSKGFRWKRIIALYLEILFYTIALSTVSILLGWESLSQKSIFNMFPVVSRNNWYVTVYFALYLISPILNTAIGKLNERSLKNLLMLTLTLFSVIPTVFFYIDQFNVASGYSILWYACMYLLGGYIGKYGIKLSKGRTLAMLLIIFLLPLSKIALITTHLANVDLSGLSMVLFKYNSVPVFLASVAFFSVFLKLELKSDVVRKVAVKLGATTFGVFYIHSFFMLRDHLWISLGSLKYIDSERFIIYSIVIVLLTFLVCSVIDSVRKKIFYLLRVDKFVLDIEEVLNRKLQIDIDV